MYVYRKYRKEEDKSAVSWNSNSPIHFKLGTVCLWNLLTKRVVDGADPTLGLLKRTAPALFEDLIQSPTPETMEKK